MKIDGGRSFSEAMRIRGLSTAQVAADFKVYRQQVDRWKRNKDMRLSRVMIFSRYFSYHVLDFLKLGASDD
tara:strand:- start:947 stop:1159 length:213 start_codon:yes stop_codon:yes gene_type:complete